MNWLPWSVLKNSGVPWRASASLSASTQKPASRVFDRRLAGARCSIDRLKPHQAHQPTGPATTDAHTLAAQVTDHLTGAVERILQEQLINTPHQRQSLRALAPGRVVERGAPNRQQTALTAQAQRWVIALNHSPSLGPAHRPDPRDKKSRSTVNSPIFA